jgi:uncharacterized protein YlaI
MKDLTMAEKEIIAKELFDELVDTCENCEEKLGVWTTNPYLEDVCGEIEHQFLCKDCHHELMMDI